MLDICEIITNSNADQVREVHGEEYQCKLFVRKSHEAYSLVTVDLSI